MVRHAVGSAGCGLHALVRQWSPVVFIWLDVRDLAHRTLEPATVATCGPRPQIVDGHKRRHLLGKRRCDELVDGDILRLDEFEDDKFKGLEELQKLTDDSVKKIEEVAAAKEKEIMQI